MKVTVKDNYLNVRVGDASINAPCYQFIAPGSQIEVDGKLYKGDMYDGIDTWLKDIGGNYYWSGGVFANSSTVDPSVEKENLGWSIKLLGVDKLWERTKGEGIKVAIIDTGIDLKNSDLSGAVIAKHNVLKGNDDVQDKGFHGTYCSSIVASRGKNGLTGTAPGCELIIIKIRENEIFPIGNEINIQEVNQLKGINEAIDSGADIISISFGSTAESPKMTALIRKIIQSGKICIAAAGNNSSDVVNFPANIKGMISVGNVGCSNPNVSAGQEDFFLSDRSPGIPSDSKHEGVTIVAPGDGVSVYDTRGRIVPNISGTSFSTPYVAGIAALWLSVIRTKGIVVNNPHNDFRKFLVGNANSNSPKYVQGTWGAGVINPSGILSI